MQRQSEVKEYLSLNSVNTKSFQRRLASVSLRPLDIRGNVPVHGFIAGRELGFLLHIPGKAMAKLRSLDLELRSVFNVADDVSVGRLALLLGGFFLGFFGCRLFLFSLLHRLLELLKRATEVYLAPFAVLRNWLATGLEQVDGPALALCTNKKKSVNQNLVFIAKIFSMSMRREMFCQDKRWQVESALVLP